MENHKYKYEFLNKRWQNLEKKFVSLKKGLFLKMRCKSKHFLRFCCLNKILGAKNSLDCLWQSLKEIKHFKTTQLIRNHMKLVNKVKIYMNTSVLVPLVHVIHCHNGHKKNCLDWNRELSSDEGADSVI